MKKIITFLPVVCILCVLSCATETKPAAGNLLLVKDAVSIKSRQKIENKDMGVSLLLDSVINDSRCAVDVNCIWQGNASAKFILEYEGVATPFVLNTTNHPNDTVLRGFKIKFINLSPENVSGKIIQQFEYSALVEVTR